MAKNYPYAISGLAKAITQLRRSFPSEVSAATLKKLGIATNNESYVLNTLRFLGLIDEKGKKTERAGTVFSQHGDSDFQGHFADLIKDAYSDLFALHGDTAWDLPQDKLISYFRHSDQTSKVVGQRQASTFQTLASLAGKVGASTRTPTAQKPREATAGTARAPQKVNVKEPVQETRKPRTGSGNSEFGLTVRIEINLPAVADQDVYDKIFRSIRENLIDT